MQCLKVFCLGQIIALCLLLLSSCGQRELKAEDWEANYLRRSTLPYGTYITYNLLDSLFSGEEIYASEWSIDEEVYDLINYNYRQQQYNEDTNEYENIPVEQSDSFLTALYESKEFEETYTYVIIASAFPENNETETALCDFVGSGNNVFLSAEVISNSLLQRLSIEDERRSILNDSVYFLENDPSKRYIFPPYSERIMYKGGIETSSFDLDSISLPYEVLGVDGNQKPYFVKVKYGFGYFYLHTVPRAFSNISMLDLNQYEYGFKCLSYLSKDDLIVWDDSVSQGNLNIQKRNLLSVILKSQALTWGLIILLLALVLFMLFRGKRVQRIIPVIKKPQNTSLAFLSTLSNMYYKKKDYASVMRKRQAFFLEFIRTHFYMNTEIIDSNFFKILSAKSDVPQYILERIFKNYKKMEERDDASVTTFMKYNEELERFYKIVKNK